MSELLRVFTSRAVEILSPKNINSFGIESHPANYQSVRFKSWKDLANQNNPTLLNAEMTKFLLGRESIKSIDDLGKEWKSVIADTVHLGTEIDKEKAYKIIRNSGIETLFGKEKNKYYSQRTALADTIVALTQLKSLSHSSNMDYLTTLKVMTFVERCFEYKMQLPELNITKYFDRQILLPSEFIRVNLCTPIQTKAFPFLELSVDKRAGTNSGCISGNCECKVNDECVPQSKCCAKPRIDLIDLLVVKDYTKSYHAGDLSFIKNVLEGETLSTKHRRLERTEELVETEEEIRQFEERYLQTEDKASLQKETESIVKQDTSAEAGVTSTYKYGTMLTVVADGRYSNNQSKSLTNKEVINSSKDIIDRATKQVEEKVRKLASTKRIFETEEKNKHSFINSSGENISGQYLYVNKLSRAQVYNYGRKAVFDLVLPEPASLYKRLFHKDYQGKKPDEPAKVTIEPKDISEENYEKLILQYKLKDTAKPPKRTLESMIHFNGGSGVEKEHVDMVRKKVKGFWVLVPEVSYYGVGSESNSSDIVVPDGYVTSNMSSDWGFNLFNGHTVTNCYVELKIGGNSIFLNGDDRPSSRNSETMSPYEGGQTIFLTANNATEFHFDLKVTFTLKPERYLEWQTGIYNKIMEVYENALTEYKKTLAEFEKAKAEFELQQEELKKERYNKNPFINRETEKAELKRMIISYISCQFYDQFDSMKNKVEPCGYPEMDIKEAEQEGKFIQFFEQAFNWNLITYIFYPYFWGKKCTWSDKLMDESNDLIFKKFLEAGSCRAMVPIRDGYFDYVSHFINYGEIWGGTGTMPLPDDPHYVSLAQEIKEQKQNFYADREGYLDTTNAGNPILTNVITLNNTDHYWNHGVLPVAAVPASPGPPPTPAIPAIPGIPAALDIVNIKADIDREIIIDCKVYRIVSIDENTTVTTHTSWNITLDRDYNGVRNPNMKWSTGALFVGAPWEFITPTTLTFLRDKSKCLPNYPLKDCIEL